MIKARRVKLEQLNEVDQAQIDLTNHALNRIERVLKDVSQLTEGPHQVYAMLLSVAGTLVRSAGLVRQAAEEKHTGKEIPLVDAEKWAVLDLLQGLGIMAKEEGE